VKVNEADAYVVDYFDVHGGGEHHLSYHGPGPRSPRGAGPAEPARGTLAGEQVEFNQTIPTPRATSGVTRSVS